MEPQAQDQLAAFCQHPQKPNLLAAADHEGYIYVFLWRGIAKDTSPPLAMLWMGEMASCVNVTSGKRPMYARKLAFHPKRDDHLVALWETHEEALDCRRYIVTVIEQHEEYGEFSLLCSTAINVPQESEGDDDEFDFSVFEFTASGDLLMLGGRGHLSFFSLHHNAEDDIINGTWKLVIEEEYHTESLEVSESNVLCCLSLQHQITPGGRKNDVVHFGLESGLILTLTMHTELGRLSFEGNTWRSEGELLPIRSLMGVPFRTPHKEATRAGCKGISFKRRVDSTKFRCLDDDYISNWALDKTSWTRTWKEGARDSDDTTFCNAAAWSHFRTGTAVVITNWGADEDTGKPSFHIHLVQPVCCNE